MPSKYLQELADLSNVVLVDLDFDRVHFFGPPSLLPSLAREGTILLL